MENQVKFTNRGFYYVVLFLLSFVALAYLRFGIKQDTTDLIWIIPIGVVSYFVGSNHRYTRGVLILFGLSYFILPALIRAYLVMEHYFEMTGISPTVVAGFIKSALGLLAGIGLVFGAWSFVKPIRDEPDIEGHFVVRDQKED